MGQADSLPLGDRAAVPVGKWSYELLRNFGEVLLDVYVNALIVKTV
jgi:hypothetical protein